MVTDYEMFMSGKVQYISSSSSSLSKQVWKLPGLTHTQRFIFIWCNLCCIFEILLASLLSDFLDLIRQIYFSWKSLWIFLVFIRYLYQMQQHLSAQELWCNALEFVSYSVTFVSQYPTQSLSRTKPAKWSRCSSKIINVIYIWFHDDFWYWGSQLS